MSTYTVRSNRTSAHILGLDQATHSVDRTNGVDYTNSHCSRISANGFLSKTVVNGRFETAREALAKAERSAPKVCANCHKAAERAIREEEALTATAA